MLGDIPTTRPPKRDVYQRARLFDEASFTHHAKVNLNLLQAILDRYSDPGDLETLDCSVEKPLEGLNNGQRLRWLTQHSRKL